MTILTELYMREMSPKQFFDQVGGTSYDSVRRHFMKLVEYGWLRRVRTAPHGRGRPEHLYRSTELAVIDDETWEELPVSIRDAFTVQLLEEMGRRLAASLVAGTFELREESVLSFVPLLVDELGWTQAIEATNGCFRALSQEQIDAKIRLEKSGSPPTLMIVELGGFEAPQHPGDGAGVLPPASPALGAPPWSQRLAKVFGDPLNLAIIDLLNGSPMSATELHAKLGGPSAEGFDRRCKMLTKLGWLAKVDALTGGFRRGATENFYRATSPDMSSAEISKHAPELAERSGWRQFETFCESAVGAVRAGAFNARADRHLTLSTLLVDEVGWRQVIALLRMHLKALERIEAEAAPRLASTDAGALSAGFYVAGFAGLLDKKALSGI